MNELVPEPVVEIQVLGQALVRRRLGQISSARGELTVKAVVARMKTLKIDDQEVTIVWMPYNWGYAGRPGRA